MDTEVRVRLAAAGFRQTTVDELLGLSPEESQMVETRLALSRLVHELRTAQRLSQTRLAGRVGSHQGNVSKAERSDPSISVDWLLKAAFALGASREDIARAIAP